MRFRKCFFPEIEVYLKQWILKQRAIRLEAKKEATKIGKYTNFKGSYNIFI